MNPTNPTGPTLADYTAPALMVPRLRGSTTAAVMEELSCALCQADQSMAGVRSESHAAMQLELLTGCDLQSGVVFPRARLAGIHHPRLALGRADPPLPWLAKFYPPTQFVFLLAEPQADSLETAQLAETVNRLRRDASVLGELRLAATIGQMLTVLGRCRLVSAEEVAKVQARQQEVVNRYAAHRPVRSLSQRR